ncbi:tetratricopeptide repeat protein [Trichlorobacter lovleyi]|nr:tetratricopeptide repeat protein [Trichlorobacter lovleyi]
MIDRAEALVLDKKYAEATSICRQVLQDCPENIEAVFLMATIYYNQKQYHESAALFRNAQDLAPQIGFLSMNRALALQEAGAEEEALEAFNQALQLDGASAGIYYNRGTLFFRLQRLDEARDDLEHALAVDPEHVGAWINLSAVCLAQDDAVGALHSCHHALRHAPGNSALTANLATAYSKLFRFEESFGCYERLVQLIEPCEKAEVLGRMANCLSDLWKVDEAIACFDHAIEISTDMHQKSALASTRLFVLHYSPQWSSSAIAAEHRRWGITYFGVSPQRTFSNSREPDRPMRVAYLSPDLRIHAVVFFLQPVLAAHDPSQVSIYLYSDVKKPDAVTRQLKDQHAVQWRDCSGLDDDAVVQQLHDDQIDLLVDLAGHTAGNRLPLFARRSAPVQISWIGYPNSTGLQQMDYRISDGWADPPGLTEQLHTEALLRMPDSFLCYRPGMDFPEPAAPPCQQNGYITFGSFSNFLKVTPAMLELWAHILAAVPGSRLVFRARGLTESRFQTTIAPIFLHHGVDPERITVLGHARSVVENLLDYGKIDIALDTFPYHGTTTTCEALCMGVPVITLAGDAHVSRVGVSLLNSVGMPELIAETPEQYQRLAVGLAGDSSRLLALRSGLRELLLASPLTDNVRFARHLEQIYRQVWQRWCCGETQ